MLLVAKNDSNLKILEMEVLKPSIHALLSANVCCATKNTSQSVPALEGAWCSRQAAGIQFRRPQSPLTSFVTMGSL